MHEGGGSEAALCPITVTKMPVLAGWIDAIITAGVRSVPSDRAPLDWTKV